MRPGLRGAGLSGIKVSFKKEINLVSFRDGLWVREVTAGGGRAAR